MQKNFPKSALLWGRGSRGDVLGREKEKKFVAKSLDKPRAKDKRTSLSRLFKGTKKEASWGTLKPVAYLAKGESRSAFLRKTLVTCRGGWLMFGGMFFSGVSGGPWL
jgi:hypothetical protein